MLDLSTLRIAFVAGTLRQGGAERQLFYLLRTLHEQGATVRLLTLSEGEYWGERIAALRIPVISVGAHPAKRVRLRRMLAALRDDPPAIVQSQHYYTNLYAVAAARRLGLREIGAIRNDVISEIGKGGWLLGRLSLWLPRHLAANSRVAIRMATQRGVPPNRLHYLPNVVDPALFEPTGSSGRGHVTLLCVGRLVRQKRIDRFIDLIARLRQQEHDHVRGLIVGAGRPGDDLSDALRIQAKRLRLPADALVFQGEVEDIKTIYQEADVLVLTSDWEGTPNVILEAMASGLPVVATRVGGVPDLVQEAETGFLVDPEDADLLTQKVAALIQDAGLRLRFGQQARQHVLRHHAPEVLPRLFSDLYQTVLS